MQPFNVSPSNIHLVNLFSLRLRPLTPSLLRPRTQRRRRSLSLPPLLPLHLSNPRILLTIPEKVHPVLKRLVNLLPRPPLLLLPQDFYLFARVPTPSPRISHLVLDPGLGGRDGEGDTDKPSISGSSKGKNISSTPLISGVLSVSKQPVTKPREASAPAKK